MNEIIQKNMEIVFKAYDIRGVYGKELTNEMCHSIGMATGTLIDTDEFVIGTDTRTHSPKVFENFVEGLNSTGVNALHVGALPNPVAYFNGFKNKIPGAYITASHNPPEYNGIKFFRGNGSSYTHELEELKGIIKSNKFKPTTSKGYTAELDFGFIDYRNFLLDRISTESRIKIVAECFNGVASTITPYLFKLFGIECVPLNNKVLGDFGGLRPEPKGENLKTLRKKVVQEKANFGIAFDGDCDRCVFIDDKGNELTAAEPGSIFIKDILEKQKGKIIATVDCPSVIARTIKENKGSLLWNRIGHGFIEEKLIEKGALFAVEQSSHFYFNKIYPFSDGFLAALKMSQIVSKTDKKLSEMTKELKSNPTEKIYINAGTHEIKLKVVENLKKNYPENVDASDGFKIILNDVEWVLIRISQNMPEVNLSIEAKTKKNLKELLKEYTKIIKNEIKKVKK